MCAGPTFAGVHKAFVASEQLQDGLGWVSGPAHTSCGVWLHVMSQLKRRASSEHYGHSFRRIVDDLPDPVKQAEAMPGSWQWPLQRLAAAAAARGSSPSKHFDS